MRHNSKDFLFQGIINMMQSETADFASGAAIWWIGQIRRLIMPIRSIII